MPDAFGDMDVVIKLHGFFFVAGCRVDKFITDDAEVLFQKGAVGVCEFSQSVDIQLFQAAYRGATDINHLADGKIPHDGFVIFA